MKLKTITADNVKGRNIKCTFGPVNLFVGPSFSGKTAVLDAIKLGLLGYHPKLGKRSAATFSLAGDGAVMAVEIELELLPDRMLKKLRHEWRPDRSGSVSYLGPDPMPLVPAVLMDTKEYFSLSKPDRLKYIFERTKVVDAVTAAALAADLKTACAGNLTPSEAGEKAIIEAVDLLNELDSARKDEDVTVQVWLETLLDQFKSTAKDAADAVKRMQGLVQGSVELKAKAGAADRLVNVDAQLTEARKKLNAARIALDRAEQDHEKAEEEQKAQAGRQARLTELRKRVPAQGLLDAGAADKLTETINRMQKGVAGYKSDRIARNTAVQKARAKVASLDRDEVRLLTEIEDETAKHADNMKLTCCPFCKSKTAGWQKAIEKAHKQTLATKDKALTALGKDRKAAKAELAKAEAALEASEVADDLNEKEQGTITELVRQREAVRDALEKSGQDRAELDALEALNPKPVTFLPAAEWEKLRDAVGRADLEVSELDLRQKQYVAATQAEAQNARARNELEQQKARAAVFKEGVDLVRATQQKLVDGAIDALLGTARRFTDGILPGTLAYQGGEIGYWKGRIWVNHETFSGTEEALAYAAFSVALAAESEVRLVMIDELGVADELTKKAILQRMVDLTADGTIEQFIGADVSKGGVADYEPLPGVTLHEVKAA